MSLRWAYYLIAGFTAKVCRGPLSSELLVWFLSGIRFIQDSIGSNALNRNYIAHFDRIFPEKTESWRKSTLHNYWKKHQRAFTALFRTAYMKPENISKKIEWINRIFLENAVADGKGVLLLAPHFGDERTLHILLAMSGFQMNVLSARYENAPENVRKARLEVTKKWHYIGFPDENPRWIYEKLKKGEIVQIAPTAWGGQKGLWVKSFGIPVLVPSSPFRIQKATGCSMIIAWNHTLPFGRYRIEFEEFYPNGSIKENAQKLFYRIEEYAKKNPDQYEWMTLAIRHRETNTIKRLGFFPSDEKELEEKAIPEDSNPLVIQTIGKMKSIQVKKGADNPAPFNDT